MVVFPDLGYTIRMIPPSRFAVGVVLALAVLLSGCGDSLFSSLDDVRTVEVRLEESQAFASPGETVELEVLYRNDEDEPLSALTVELRNPRDGLSLVHQEDLPVSMITASGIIPVLLPSDLPEGIYVLESTGWRGAAEVFTSTRRIIVARELPEVRNLFLHPSRPVTDSRMIAVAHLAVPEGQRPWVRWYRAGVFLQEGYAVNGVHQVHLDAGMEAGSVAVRLAVFPWGPEEGLTEREFANPPVTEQGQVVVQRTFSPGELLRTGESLVWYPLQGHRRGGVYLAPGHRDRRLELREAANVSISDGVALQLVSGTLGYFVPHGETLTVPVPLFAHTDLVPEIAISLVVSETGSPLVVSFGGEEEGTFRSFFRVQPDGSIGEDEMESASQNDSDLRDAAEGDLPLEGSLPGTEGEDTPDEDHTAEEGHDGREDYRERQPAGSSGESPGNRALKVRIVLEDRTTAIVQVVHEGAVLDSRVMEFPQEGISSAVVVVGARESGSAGVTAAMVRWREGDTTGNTSAEDDLEDDSRNEEAEPAPEGVSPPAGEEDVADNPEEPDNLEEPSNPEELDNPDNPEEPDPEDASHDGSQEDLAGEPVAAAYTGADRSNGESFDTVES